jgi:hypothetical protein
MPPLEPTPRTSLAGLEESHLISESAALLIIEFPEQFSAQLVESGDYTHDKIKTEYSEKGRLKWAHLTGITERADEKCFTEIQITLAGMFGRGIARLRDREPWAIASVKYQDLQEEARNLDREIYHYFDHVSSGPEEPDF